MALAGLASVAAAGLWHQDPRRPPVLVAESATPAQCRAWTGLARAQERYRQGWWDVFEGFSTLQGLCHPRDIPRGRALIERALALRLDDRLVIDYVLALRTVGDTQHAQAWLPFSTIVSIRRDTLRDWIDGSLRPGMGFDATEFGYLIEQGDALGSRQRALSLLAEEPVLPDLEADALESWISRISMFDWGEFYFLRYRAAEAGRIKLKDGETLAGLLVQAAVCHHSQATRILAGRFLTDEDFTIERRSLAAALVVLHRRSGEDGELLNAVLRRQGRTVEDIESSGDIALFMRRWHQRCERAAFSRSG